MTNITTKRISKQCNFYYRKGDLMPYEEDLKHEFKRHTSMAVEDLPPWTQEYGSRTKRSISRSINAFLNSELGGTVYLGVSDAGVINGLKLSLFQKDHLRVNLDNLMRRYKPPVSPERYQIHFVPVVPSDASEADAIRIFSKVQKEELSSDERRWQNGHLCQTYENCWCIPERQSLYDSTPFQDYVAEIELKPWDPEKMKWNYVTPNVNIQPFYSNEEGNVFIRTLASNVLCDDQEIVKRTRRKVAQFYNLRINSIKEQIKQLES